MRTQWNGELMDIRRTVQTWSSWTMLCVKKMMKNRRSYSAATCAAVIGAGHPLRNSGVCWYATKQPSWEKRRCNITTYEEEEEVKQEIERQRRREAFKRSVFMWEGHGQKYLSFSEFYPICPYITFKTTFCTFLGVRRCELLKILTKQKMYVT